MAPAWSPTRKLLRCPEMGFGEAQCRTQTSREAPGGVPSDPLPDMATADAHRLRLPLVGEFFWRCMLLRHAFPCLSHHRRLCSFLAHSVQPGSGDPPSLRRCGSPTREERACPKRACVRLLALRVIPHQADHAADGDRLLNVLEAARKLGKSKDYLDRHADDYPFTVRDGRSLRFSEAGIEKFIRQRMGR